MTNNRLDHFLHVHTLGNQLIMARLKHSMGQHPGAMNVVNQAIKERIVLEIGHQSTAVLMRAVQVYRHLLIRRINYKPARR